MLNRIIIYGIIIALACGFMYVMSGVVAITRRGDVFMPSVAVFAAVIIFALIGLAGLIAFKVFGILFLISAVLYGFCLYGIEGKRKSQVTDIYRKEGNLVGSRVIDTSATPQFRLGYERVPKLDGDYAYCPLYHTVAGLVYPPVIDAERYSIFNLTGYAPCTGADSALKRLVAGQSDIVFLSGLTYDMKSVEVAEDSLTVYVNKSNQIENLTKEQFRQILSGTITNWKEFGGDDANIELILNGSEHMQKVLQQHGLSREFVPVEGNNSAMKKVETERNAVGIAFSGYVSAIADADVKHIAIDDTDMPVYALMRDEDYFPQQQTLLDWLISPAGKELIKNLGYKVKESSDE